MRKLLKKVVVTVAALAMAVGGVGIQSAFAADKVKQVSYQIEKSAKEYVDEKGTAILTLDYQKPVLAGKTAAVKKINQFYDKLEKKWYAAEAKELKNAIDVKKEAGKEYHTYTSTFTTEVTYNKNGVISILGLGYDYTGGNHGQPYRETHTFDLNTGKELKTTDILKGTKTQINSKILAAFTKVIQRKPSNYFETALTDIKKEANVNRPFYLGKSGVVFYCDPYLIAPYATGFVEASIPYSAANTFKLNLK